jgi:pimeloyl-ACP methyl ester carboxylesterase
VTPAELVINGVRTAVHDVGAGETVVLVHGNPGPMDDWDFLAPALAERFRVIAMDLPGFGRADRPQRFDYSVAGMATFLDRVLEARGVERAHVVAHDFGGLWATAWAEMNPTRLRSLTLVSSPLSTSFRWHSFARVWQTPLVGELFQLGAARRLIRAVRDLGRRRSIRAGEHRARRRRALLERRDARARRRRSLAVRRRASARTRARRALPRRRRPSGLKCLPTCAPR